MFHFPHFLGFLKCPLVVAPSQFHHPVRRLMKTPSGEKKRSKGQIARQNRAAFLGVGMLLLSGALPVESQTKPPEPPPLSQVQLRFLDAAPSEILRALQKQAAAFKIALRLPSVDELSAAPVSLDLQGEFWPVLQKASQTLGLRVMLDEGQSPNQSQNQFTTRMRLVPLASKLPVAKLSRSESLGNVLGGPSTAADGFLLVLNSVQMDRRQNYAVRFETPVTPNQRLVADVEKDDEKVYTRAFFSLFVDPRLSIIARDTRLEVEAIPAPQPAPPNLGGSFFLDDNFSGLFSLNQILFAATPDAPKATLRGQVSVVVVQETKKWEIDDVLGGVDSTFEVPCEVEGKRFTMIYTLENARMAPRSAKQPAQIELSLSLEAQRPAGLTDEKWWRRALESQQFRSVIPSTVIPSTAGRASSESRSLFLRENSGQFWESQGYSIGSDNSKTNISLRFAAKTPGSVTFPKLALVWQVPTQVEKRNLPFQFNDVPMPRPLAP